MLREGRLGARHLLGEVQENIVTNAAGPLLDEAHYLQAHRVAQRFKHTVEAFVILFATCRRHRRPPCVCSTLHAERLGCQDPMKTTEDRGWRIEDRRSSIFDPPSSIFDLRSSAP